MAACLPGSPYWISNTSSSYDAATSTITTKWYGIDTAAGTSSSALAVMDQRALQGQQDYMRREMERAMRQAVKEGRDRFDFYDHERAQRLSFPIKKYRQSYVMPDWKTADREPMPSLPKPRPLVRLDNESLLTALDRAFQTWVGYVPLQKKLQRAHNEWTKETRRCLGLTTIAA